MSDPTIKGIPFSVAEARILAAQWNAEGFTSDRRYGGYVLAQLLSKYDKAVALLDGIERGGARCPRCAVPPTLDPKRPQRKHAATCDLAQFLARGPDGTV